VLFGTRHKNRRHFGWLRAFGAAAIIAFAITWSAPASAAQNGRVVANTVLRDHPESDAAVLVQVKQGDILRISSKSKEGWFKVLLPDTQGSPQYGWISAQELIPTELAEEMRASNIQSGNSKYFRQKTEDDMKPNEWSVALYLQLTSVNPHDLQGFVGADSSTIPKTTVAGEINLSPDQWVGLSFYGSYLSVDGTSGDGNGTYKASVAFLGGIVDYYPLKTTYDRLGVGLGFLGVSAWMSAQYLNASTLQPAAGSQKFLTMGSLLRVTFRQHFTPDFGLGANAGYRYINQKTIGMANGTTNLQMSGFYLEAGLFLEF